MTIKFPWYFLAFITLFLTNINFAQVTVKICLYDKNNKYDSIKKMNDFLVSQTFNSSNENYSQFKDSFIQTTNLNNTEKKPFETCIHMNDVRIEYINQVNTSILYLITNAVCVNPSLEQGNCAKKFTSGIHEVYTYKGFVLPITYGNGIMPNKFSSDVKNIINEIFQRQQDFVDENNFSKGRI